MRSQKVEFTNHNGYKLSARLELPIDSHPVAYAIFAHVFTGNKSLSATRHISRALSLSGIGVLRFDFTGLGQSEGDFANGSLSIWRDEVVELIAAQISGDRVIVIGSSMGGWLMLLVGLALGEKLAGLVGIAPAPDFSDWGFDDAQKAHLRSGKTIFEESEYGYDPMPTHAKFWHDAERLRLLDTAIAINCPVRLLHGQEDVVVPPDISLRLAAALASDDVQITLSKGGDHRLSRPADIALLLNTLSALTTSEKPVSSETK